MGRKRKTVAEKALICPKPIQCNLRASTEYGTSLPNWNPEKKRFGRYSGSTHTNIPDKRYVVLMRIEGDFNSYLEEGLSDREIVEGCLEFLNTPPPRKKYAKKTPKPPYGVLELVRYQRKQDDSGNLCYVAACTTNQKKNKHFWGTGRGK